MPRAAALVALAAAVLLPALAATTVEPLVDRRLVLRPGHMCGTQGRYKPGSAYEANLRRLATTVAAEVNASPCNCSAGSVAGRRRPDQVTASAYCYWRPSASTLDCGACVALAFREAQRLCPYHKRAVAIVDGGACSVSFQEVQQRRAEDVRKISHYQYNFIFRYGYTLYWWINQDVLLMLLFQATGLACVVFLFLQEWRTRSRGPAIVPSIEKNCRSYMHYSIELSVTGDQLLINLVLLMCWKLGRHASTFCLEDALESPFSKVQKICGCQNVPYICIFGN